MNIMSGYLIRVEFEDVDSYKIAHHTKLLAYLERARTDYFSNVGIPLGELPFAVLVQQVSMRFISSARLFDEVTVSVAIKSCESYKFVVEQKIMRGSELLVKAQVTHALQDFNTSEIVAVPDTFFELMIPRK